MADLKLSAVLELKDQFTSQAKKVKISLTGIKDEAEKASKSSEKLKDSLSGIKGSYSTTVGVKDNATSFISKVSSNLRSFAGKTHSAVLGVKDNATAKITKVKTDLTSIAGKTYTAMINVKSNMPPGGLNLGQKASGMADGLLMGTGMQMAGAAGIGFGIYDTVKKSMDFDAQLSQISSLIPKEGQDGQSREDIMKQVRERAMDLGASTAFGNKEVAEGMTELIKAGVQLKDVLGDASEAALNLATAGGLDLAQAAETMSTAMNAFKVTDATHAADILAGAANASATDVGELRYALASVSSVAAGAGVSFDDVNTALAVFAQNGLKGSDAGTSLKTMLTNMIPKTKTQVEALSKLNLLAANGSSLFFDEAGNMKSLADIAGLLQDRLGGLSKEQKMSYLYDIFGSDAIRAGMILTDEGAGGVQKMFGDMSKITAKDMALEQLNNLKGDIEELSGAWENFQNILMEGKGTSGLRGLAQELTSVVRYASDLAKDGLGISDAFKVAGKVINDLVGKFMQLDGIGSALAGGALLLGLRQIYKLSQGIVGKVKSINDIVNGIRGFGDKSKLPTGNKEIGSSVKNMVVNAANVVINGKPGSSPNVPELPGKEKTTPKTSPKATPKTVLGNLKDGGKWLGGHIKGVGGAMAGVSALMGAYDIYNAPEGQKAQAAGSAVGSIGGGLAGAKLGAMAGGAIGSFIPGLGTAVGAGIGGIVGGIGGSILGSNLGESISRLLDFSAKDNIAQRINDSSWGKAQNMSATTNMNVSQTQYEGISSAFGDIAQQNGQVQLQSSQAQMESQKQMFLRIKDIASDVWNSITESADTAGQMQVQNAQIQAQANIELWNNIKESGANAWESIKNKWDEAVSWFTNIYNQLQSLAESAGNGIANGINSAISTIQGAYSNLVDWFETNVFSPIRQKYLELKNSAPSPVKGVLNFFDGDFGKNATGTMNWKGGFTEINERGGEIVDLPTGSRIYPAQTTQRIIEREIQSASGNSSSSPSITITGNTFTVREEADIDKIAYQLMHLLSKAQRNYGGVY